MTLGEKLQKLRKQAGLSQEQLALQLNVSRQAISKWELNTAKPDTDNIIQICRLFQVSTDSLLLDEQALSMQTDTSPAAPSQAPFPYLLSGWILSFLGAIGILIFAILNSVFPAVIYEPAYGTVRAIVDTGFSAFLTHHRIGWLFALCCIILLAGICLLLLPKLRQKAARSHT